MVQRSAAPAATAQTPAGSWLAVSFFIVTAAIVVFASTREFDLGRVVVIAAAAALALLFALYLLVRSVTYTWLIAFGCFSAALASLLHARESGVDLVRVSELLFAAAALPALIILFQKWRAAPKKSDELLLAGSGTILIALVAEAIEGFCPPGEMCFESDPLELYLIHHYWIVFFALAAFVFVNASRRYVSSAWPSVVFAVLAVIVALWDLHSRLPQLLWAAGAIMTFYAVIGFGRRVSRYEVAMLGGLALCDVALYLKWIDYGEYAITSPRNLTGHALMFPLHFAALMLIAAVLTVPRFRVTANIAGIAIAAATAMWWVRKVILIKNLRDPWNGDPDALPDHPLFHAGSLVFGIGIFIVIAAMIAMTIQEKRHAAAA